MASPFDCLVRVKDFAGYVCQVFGVKLIPTPRKAPVLGKADLAPYKLEPPHNPGR